MSHPEAPLREQPARAFVVDVLRWWDIEQIAVLEQQLFAGDSPWTAEMFWSELAAGHHYVVVRDGQGVLGYAGLASHGPDAPTEDAEVQTIGVRDDQRRRGVGAALLDDLLAAAGRRRVLLEVRVDNEAAQRLYTSRGFRRIGTRRGYYQPSGADALVMERIAG